MRSFVKSRDRNGQSLVLILFVLIALIGVMALTLDFGFVLLARRQMQTGVNSAAIEGLRGQGLYDEEQRRENAQNILQLSYDEVLDSRDKYIDRPDPQLNSDNLVHGDIVVGQYVGPADPDVEQRPIAGHVHEEFSTYERTDFRTPEDGDFDPDIGSQAFLVRLRRTHNPHGLDDVSGASSRGGGLPLMLGRAGWMRAADESAEYSIRRDGVAVRATAIAHGTPALAVAKANTAHGLKGLANFVLATEFWASDAWKLSGNDGEETIEVNLSGTNVEYSGEPVGHLIDSTRSNVSVGECINGLGTSSGMESGYAPLSALVRSLDGETAGEKRVVAFGDIVSATEIFERDNAYTLTRRRSSVGTQNVSATFLQTDHLTDPSFPVDVDQLMQQRRAVTLRDPEREVLLRPLVVLAPALARTVR